MASSVVDAVSHCAMQNFGRRLNHNCAHRRESAVLNEIHSEFQVLFSGHRSLLKIGDQWRVDNKVFLPAPRFRAGGDR